MIVKAIIHKVDAFVVLPREGGREDSFLNQLHRFGTLKAKAKFGHRFGLIAHEDGRECHWIPGRGEGVRNPDTGGASSIAPSPTFHVTSALHLGIIANDELVCSCPPRDPRALAPCRTTHSFRPPLQTSSRDS